MCYFWNVLFLNVPFLECAVFGMCCFWNVLFLECALFGMCLFEFLFGICSSSWILKFKICLGHTSFHYAVSTLLSLWSVPFLECALFGICRIRNMPYLECSTFGMCIQKRAHSKNSSFQKEYTPKSVKTAWWKGVPQRQTLGFTRKSKFQIEHIYIEFCY